MAPSKTAPRPILHCPPVPGPQPLRERSDPIPLGQIAQPPPPLTWAGLLRDRRDTGSQTGSTQLTAPGPGSIYGCPHPLLPVLRNFWKVGNASGELRGSQKEKKNAKDLPQTAPAPAPVPAGRSPSPWVLLPPRPAGLGVLLLRAWTSLDSSSKVLLPGTGVRFSGCPHKRTLVTHFSALPQQIDCSLLPGFNHAPLSRGGPLSFALGEREREAGVSTLLQYWVQP